MKNRRLSKVSIFTLSIIIVLLVALVFGGCTEQSPAPASNTLKIGVLCNLGGQIDMAHGLEVMADMDNNKGGLDIGGEKYNVEFIIYDSAADQATATAAANRLIFEDEVNFIVCEPGAVDAILPITEQNKVLMVCGSYTPQVLSPDNQYSFQACFCNIQEGLLGGWLAQNYPGKSYVCVCPDNFVGHAVAPLNQAHLETFGVTEVTNLFYPESTTDLSAIATKVKSLNPDVLMAFGGASSNQVYKAAWVAGWRGQMFGNNAQPAYQMSQTIPLEALEGYIGGAWPVEFEPPATELAEEFKDAYIDKYGEWDYPEVQWLAAWSCMRAGMQKAGSLDVDQVADVIANGLEFESPCGEGLMVSRPDMGNNRTIDSIIAFSIKQVVDGEVTLVHTMTLDETRDYFKQMYE